MRHFFIRDARQFPVACVASKVTESVPVSDEGSETKPTEIGFSVSILNPKDTFNKHKARQIAYERLNRNMMDTIPVQEGNMKEAILQWLLSNSPNLGKRGGTRVPVPKHMRDAILEHLHAMHVKRQAVERAAEELSAMATQTIEGLAQSGDLKAALDAGLLQT
jgi:hypothetical protein